MLFEAVHSFAVIDEFHVPLSLPLISRVAPSFHSPLFSSSHHHLLPFLPLSSPSLVDDDFLILRSTSAAHLTTSLCHQHTPKDALYTVVTLFSHHLTPSTINFETPFFTPEEEETCVH